MWACMGGWSTVYPTPGRKPKYVYIRPSCVYQRESRGLGALFSTTLLIQASWVLLGHCSGAPQPLRDTLCEPPCWWKVGALREFLGQGPTWSGFCPSILARAVASHHRRCVLAEKYPFSADFRFYVEV